LKAWIIVKLRNNEEVTTINNQIVLEAMKVVKYERVATTCRVNTPTYSTYLKMRECVGDNIRHTCCAQNIEHILLLEAHKIVTTFNNHYRLQFINCIRAFVNRSLGVLYVDNIIENGTRKERKENINELKIYIIQGINMDMDHYLMNIPTLHEWWVTHRDHLLPFQRIRDSMKKNDTFIDTLVQLVQTQPNLFMKCMFYMCDYLEQNGLKCMQLFPQRHSNVYQHIQIDTVSMVDLLVEDGRTALMKGSISSAETRQIWHKYFDLSRLRRPFSTPNKEYIFGSMIQTDGYSLSITYIPQEAQINKDKVSKSKLQKRKEIHEELKDLEPVAKARRREEMEDVKKAKAREKLQQRKQYAKEKQPDRRNINGIYYVDVMTDVEKADALIRPCAFIDPGKKTLLTMVDKNGRRLNYSNKKRLFDTKRLKIASRIHRRRKKDMMIVTQENLLLGLNSKSVGLESYEKYTEVKNRVFENVEQFYADPHFRKDRLYLYVERRRADDILINDIKEKFGDNVVLFLGINIYIIIIIIIIHFLMSFF